jgi:exopolyphosphatase/guanosine-5'-triphosphate,3'-diphosphate pyrophosphatase
MKTALLINRHGQPELKRSVALLKMLSRFQIVSYLYTEYEEEHFKGIDNQFLHYNKIETFLNLEEKNFEFIIGNDRDYINSSKSDNYFLLPGGRESIKSFIFRILRDVFKDKRIEAVFDVGTNNVLMLWGEIKQNHIITHHRTNSVSALGLNMKDNLVTGSALSRLKRILDIFIPLSQAVTMNISILATSCSRDALNIDYISEYVSKRYGLIYNIISDNEEALLNGYANLDEFEELSRFLSFDIGGGSTEFTYIEQKQIRTVKSIKLGIRRLHNHFKDDIEGIRTEILRLLDTLRIEIEDEVQLIGIGGTVANITAISKGLRRYDSLEVHRSELHREQLEKYMDRFSKMRLDEIRELMPFEPQRAEIIITGILVILEIMNKYNKDSIFVSDHGLMYGYLNRRIIQEKTKNERV